MYNISKRTKSMIQWFFIIIICLFKHTSICLNMLGSSNALNYVLNMKHII